MIWSNGFRFLIMGNTRPEPTDGTQDKRPWIKCSHCKQLALCYRGQVTKVVETEAGPFTHWAWICATCFSAMVGEALREEPA